MKRKNYERTADGKYRGVIYMYSLNQNGQSYIGQTQNERNRKMVWQSGSDYSRGKIKDARSQYGNDINNVWTYSVIEEIVADTIDVLKEKLNDRETYWISYYDTVNNGFNSSYGSGMKGMKHKPDTIQKMKTTKTGKHHSPEAKAHIQEAVRKKMGIALVVVFPDNHQEKYPSMKMAADALAMSLGTIHYYLYSKKEYNGYKFNILN